MNTASLPLRLSILAFVCSVTIVACESAAAGPNVILIVCDDLNDYIEGLDGHPQTKTPNIARLARSGVSFHQAHCNIPICGPSRASLFTGIYPHNSGCFGFTKWDTYEVLKNSRTIMDHFRANGYVTLGTGKLMHHMVRREWSRYGNPADYGPFAFDGENKTAHPDVPAPFREIGAIDGSFGPLMDVSGRKNEDGNPYSWQTGGWSKQRELRYKSDDDRDPTADELNGDWAVQQIRQFGDSSKALPFFMGVGFIRPHTPLIVPQRFFDMFPLESIELPNIRADDVSDTHAASIRGLVGGAEPNAPRTEDMGTRLYNTLASSYESDADGLRRFIQAYLASVASVDEQVGRILDALDASPLKDNTIVVFTSDHGWGMGEKNYLYKNSLWQESTRVPLIVRAPGVAKKAGAVDKPVSLIDVFPTLVDLCQLEGDTKKNDKGHALDGFSLKTLLENPESGDGPSAALTALYKWRMRYSPSEESYALRSKNWRYIRYENGREELYDTVTDPFEWTNLAADISHAETLRNFRAQLLSRIPAESDPVPTQPAFKPKPTPAKKSTEASAEAWKDKYFSKHPSADTNKDGKLSWPEYKAHRGPVNQ